MTLTKYTPNLGYSIIVALDDTLQYTRTVASGINVGGYAKFQYGQWVNYSSILPGGVSVTPGENGCEKIGPITQDIVLINGNLYNYCGTYIGQEGGTAPEGTITSTIGSVVLKSENDWTYLWQGLPTGDAITYSLVETAVDGYEATYQLNSNDLAAGGVITLGNSGDLITVTNKAASNPTYELPDTGGHGTMGYTLGGVTLTAGAALWLLCRRKRRREAL